MLKNLLEDILTYASDLLIAIFISLIARLLSHMYDQWSDLWSDQRKLWQLCFCFNYCLCRWRPRWLYRKSRTHSKGSKQQLNNVLSLTLSMSRTAITDWKRRALCGRWPSCINSAFCWPVWHKILHMVSNYFILGYWTVSTCYSFSRNLHEHQKFRRQTGNNEHYA